MKSSKKSMAFLLHKKHLNSVRILILLLSLSMLSYPAMGDERIMGKYEIPALQKGDVLIYPCYEGRYEYYDHEAHYDYEKGNHFYYKNYVKEEPKGNIVLDGSQTNAKLQYLHRYLDGEGFENPTERSLAYASGVGDYWESKVPAGFIHNNEYFDLNGDRICREEVLWDRNIKLSSYNREHEAAINGQRYKSDMPRLERGDTIIFNIGVIYLFDIIENPKGITLSKDPKQNSDNFKTLKVLTDNPSWWEDVVAGSWITICSKGDIVDNPYDAIIREKENEKNIRNDVAEEIKGSSPAGLIHYGKYGCGELTDCQYYAFSKDAVCLDIALHYGAKEVCDVNNVFSKTEENYFHKLAAEGIEDGVTTFENAVHSYGAKIISLEQTKKKEHDFEPNL